MGLTQTCERLGSTGGNGSARTRRPCSICSALVAPGHREVSAAINRPAGSGVWSALEYGLHSAFVLPILGHEIEVILAHDRRGVHDPCPEIDIEDATRR